MTYTSTHWGVYRPVLSDGKLSALTPFERDRAPSPIGPGMATSIEGPTRIRRPAIRRGFLKNGAASRDQRGAEPFVELPWDEALDITADALKRTIAEHGNEAVFGGSYGWASAGRFHHANGQIHRFLNCIGGYVSHRDSYSLGAARVLLPRIIAPIETLNRDASGFAGLAKHCQTFVAFGGLPTKNAQINAGGVGDHVVGDWIQRMDAAGVKFVNISPLRGDLESPGVEWVPIRPNTDAAVLLALAYEVVALGLHNFEFLNRCCVGA
ncbi:MAG: molybdopterin-dependent oxidoreductase, partial [Elsteraceae bacterium]